MKDYDVWEKYQADKAASKKAKEEAKYEAGKRALDSKYDQQKKSEEIAKAAKLKMANDAVESHRRAGNIAGGKPQYVKDNEKRIKDFENKQAVKKADDNITKVTKKEVTVEAPASDLGNIGSVDRMNPEVIGADMGRTKPAPIEERSFNMPKDEGSRFSSSNPMGMKRGGAVKSSASSRGDGIAQRGKTKGRMC